MITNIPFICTIIAIVACIYASYSDLKEGIIQNKLTFPLIGLGIILNGIYTFTIGNLWLIIAGIISTAMIFVLSYILWKGGAWAGGDVKLFTALAALIPLYSPLYPYVINYNLFNVPFPIIGTYPFPLTLIINSILSMLPFLLIYVIYTSVKSKPHLISELLKPINEYKKNIVLTLVITSAVTLTIFITSHFNLNSFLPYQIIIISLILIYLLSLIISKLPNRVKAVVMSLLIVFSLFNNLSLTISSAISLFVIITVIEIVKKLLFTVSREALQDDYKVQDLKEGMIPAYSIYQQNSQIYIDDKGYFEKIKEAAKEGNIANFMHPKGKILINSRRAAGLSADDIKLLKNCVENSELENKLRIKKGVPFAPSILIGLLISLFIGDLALLFQKVLYVLFT